MADLRNLFEGWLSVSKEEQAQRRDDMSKRVFRFGDEAQRPVVIKLLDELFGSTRSFSDQDQLFAYISARNVFALACEKNPVDATPAAAKQLRSLGWRKEERLRTLLALLELDERAPSLEEYPTADQVRTRASALQVPSRNTGAQINFGRFKF
jgi:hypothetical protein